MSDERDRMLEIIWREKKADLSRPEDETIPMYNTSEIYDDPAEYSTTRGIFAYTNVAVIPW